MGQLQDRVSFNFANAMVVIVDASPFCTDIASRILTGFGFRKMYRCERLEKAADIARTSTIDLLLLDPQSFGEQAHSFLRWLREDERGANAAVPVLLLTRHTAVHNIAAARDSGADFVVAKPFSPSVLLERILWVAMGEGRRGELLAPASLVTSQGSEVELW